jgi:adenylate cyclase class 2
MGMVQKLLLWYTAQAMYEIELKAHVADPQAVRAALNGFASFLGTLDKQDWYWKQQSGPRGAMQVRLRTERVLSAPGAAPPPPERHLVTYKRKELRVTHTGSAPIEVNDEREFFVTNRDAFRLFLEDASFRESHQKHKIVDQWAHEDALIELCCVPPLGYFLEIEILSPTNDGKTVAVARRTLESLIQRAGVSLEAIEPRYYSDLLLTSTPHATPAMAEPPSAGAYTPRPPEIP